MYPHRIRLRGPWQCVPLADPSAVRTVRFPLRWEDAGVADWPGPIQFLRAFGLPRRLDPHERVWLVLDGIAEPAEVALNSVLLSPAREFDVTELLRPRNELSILVAAGERHGAWGEAVLEIRATAWLADIAVQIESCGDSALLRICGTVRGYADNPMDLYALIGRSTVLQATVRAGDSFEVVSEAMPPDRWQGGQTVRIEMMNGASVWYALERPAAFRSSEKTP